ncbi:MAG TPA: zinc ribbon domain-containing protein YjdM [Cryomorphaceae bacterium]|nr:zinc ribbon domain-containing protein YjdM [Cryomorphaceae bacterium]
MPDQIPPCPECKSSFTYELDFLIVCPECGNEWNPKQAENEAEVAPTGFLVLDANGNTLQDGDAVVVVKNLPVKGAPQPVKAGTKIKNIKLVEGDHNIDCKIEGFGSMALKSEFVKKA